MRKVRDAIPKKQNIFKLYNQSIKVQTFFTESLILAQN